MKLKTRKRIIVLTSALSICGGLIMSNVTKADVITSKGIKEYNGKLYDQAYAWTGSNNSYGRVDATVVRTKDWSLIVDTIDYDGWAQNPQTSYAYASVMGLHSAGTGSGQDTYRSWP